MMWFLATANAAFPILFTDPTVFAEHVQVARSWTFQGEPVGRTPIDPDIDFSDGVVSRNAQRFPSDGIGVDLSGIIWIDILGGTDAIGMQIFGQAEVFIQQEGYWSYYTRAIGAPGVVSFVGLMGPESLDLVILRGQDFAIDTFVLADAWRTQVGIVGTDLEITGRPNASVALVAGTRPRITPLSAGPCVDGLVGVRGGVRLVATVALDAAGYGTFPTVGWPAGWFVDGMDLGTCQAALFAARVR